ncbi:MAG: DUF3592 domain-containing protein [Mariniphaga sp.]
MNQTTNRKRKSNNTSLGIIFTLVGALIFYFWGWPPLKYALDSKEWPATEGTITHSEVDNWLKEGKSQYEARISYSYEVDGKKYNSTRIYSNGSYSGGNITKAKELADKYPSGKTVDVYYDPELPESAALKPGVSGNDILMAALPLLFLLAGLAVLIGALKPQRSTPTNMHGRTDIRNVIKNITNR